MTPFLCPVCPVCPVCDDERPFVPPGGQGWTTRAGAAATVARSAVRYVDHVSGCGVP